MIVLVLAHALLMVTLDQASKVLVLSCLPHGRRASLGPWMQIRCMINRRGMGGRGLRTAIGLWGVTVVAALLFAAYSPLSRSAIMPMGLGWALGGATGNLIDRARRGGIIDFIDCRVWPVFNVADAGIVIGAGVVFWCLG